MIYRWLKNESLPACAAYTLSDSSGSEYEFEVFHNNVPDAAKLFLAKDENLSFEGFVQELTQYFNSQVCSEIFETTISQSCSDIWKYQRIGRITASNVFGCLHFTGKNADGSLVKSILGQCTYYMSSVPSINHGKKYESKGRDQYLQSLRSKHNNVHFEPAGLLVCETDPYIGASPDGLIECQCCGKGCIEIKCPDTNADKESKHAASLDTKNFYVQDGAPHLKENISSPYYCQIQCQLAWADPEIFKRRGRTSKSKKKKKKNAIGSIRCMLRGTMFSFILMSGRIFSLANGWSVGVCVGGGVIFVQGNLE